MSRTRVIIALLGLMAMYTFSSFTSVDSGTVTQKNFVPSHEYQSAACATSPADHMSCHLTAPDTWYLTISAEGVTNMIPVSQADFDSHEVYGYYDGSQ